MPVEFEDVAFRDVAKTGRHLGVCSDDPEQAARVARASASGPAPNLSQLIDTATACDAVPDVSSSAAEPVTAVDQWMTKTTTMIGRQARYCNRTLRTFWSRLIPLQNMPLSQTRTQALIFRPCAIV
jgi:hypothetical protein